MRIRNGYVISPILLTCLAIVVVGAIAAYAYDAGQKNSTSTTVAVATPTPTKSATAASPTPTPATATPTPSTDIPAALKVTNTFMTYMTNAGSANGSASDLLADRSNVLELFTPAQTTAEKNDFAFLAGTDLGLSNNSSVTYPNARILGGTNGFGYTVTNFTIGTGTENDGTVTFPINETRKTWSGTAYINSTETDYADLVQVSGSWMVADYYVKNFTAATSEPGESFKI